MFPARLPAWLNLYNVTIHEIQVLGKNDRKWPVFRQKVVIFGYRLDFPASSNLRALNIFFNPDFVQIDIKRGPKTHPTQHRQDLYSGPVCSDRISAYAQPFGPFFLH